MLSVIMPTYQRGSQVRPLIIALAHEIEKISMDYEIILVDDGSSAACQRDLVDAMGDLPMVRLILLESNVGQQNATLAGLRLKQYPLSMTLDDDLGVPSVVHQLLDTYNQGYDLVYADRVQVQRAAYRSLGTWLKEGVFRAFIRKPKDLKLTSLRIMSPALTAYVCADQIARVYLSARALQLKPSATTIYIPMGQASDTRYTLIKLVQVLWCAFRDYGPLGSWLGVKAKDETDQYIIKDTDYGKIDDAGRIKCTNTGD